MKITKTRIRSIGPYLSHLAADAKFRVAVRANELPAKASAIGFNPPYTQGAAILPPIIGSVSRFNAEGRWHALKDRPKEYRYLFSREWRWKEWGTGIEDSKFIDYSRLCYQRELEPPPSEEVISLSRENVFFLVSRVLVNRAQDERAILHVVNLFLELFGECEILSEDLLPVWTGKVVRHNWEILPPGSSPWRIQLQRTLARASENTRKVIQDRLDAVRSFSPDEIHVGKWGFEGYIAFVFRDRELVIMESKYMGNAMYVLGLDWKEVSKLSKAEIIDGNHHVARIIHSDGWKERLAGLFD